MENKKLWQTVISAVAIVWIFCISFAVSMKVAENQREKATTAYIPQTQMSTTTTTSTTMSTTEGTTMKRNPVVGNYVTAEATVGDPDWLIAEQSSIAESSSIKASEEASKKAEQTTTEKKSNVPSTKAEIINAYINGVNALKREANFSLKVKDQLNITIDEMTGGSLVQSFADAILAEQNKTEPDVYTFSGGVDASKGVRPTSVIAPLNRDASVNNDAVLTAEATPSGSGYKVKLTLIDEVQTYTNPAPNHLTTVEVVDVAPLLPSGATIDSLEMRYTGTTIEATFNGDGKIISMRHYLCVSECTGSGSFTLIPISVKIHGDFISEYTITY